MLARVGVTVLALSAVVAGQDAAEWARRAAAAKLSLADAIAKGVAEVGSGAAIHAELEMDKGALVYSVDVAQGAKTCNVVLDAADGRVVEKDVADEDHAEEAAALKVALPATIAAALARVPGTAVEAQLGLRGGKPVVGVRVWAEGKIQVVRVDGATGEVLAAAAAPVAPAGPAFTEIFREAPGDWTCTGANPYFSLEPGHVLVLEGGGAHLTITVLPETKVVDGVETRIIEERELEGGQLIEVSRNYYALSKRTNSVYYFGEDVDMYKDGKIVGHAGAWLSGVSGARWGLMIPGTPLLGARYYQEIAPGVALDRAEVIGVNETFKTAAGTFEGCLKTEETTPLEPGKGYKVYAPGVGLVTDADVTLTKVIRPGQK